MEKLEKITNPLMKWYEENKRDLPWRINKDAYRIWVSEIMLQQTRVEAVLSYYERFLKTYPNITALANTTTEELHKVWEGLGYYRRADHMKKCAQVCVEQYGGKMPNNYQQLLELPGIGTYTAGAIASIAYKEKVAAVDGNVLRVFSRILCREEDIAKESTKKLFQQLLLEYIPEEQSDIFNQAVMELGALVCVPNGAPRCNICPVVENCKAYQEGKAAYLPIKTGKKQRKVEKRTVIVLVKENKIFIRQRNANGLLANLYEFLNLEGHYSEKELEVLLGKEAIVNIIKLNNSKHIFSHIEWNMIGYLCEVKDCDLEGKFITYEELQNQYALPSAFRAYKESLYEYFNSIE